MYELKDISCPVPAQVSPKARAPLAPPGGRDPTIVLLLRAFRHLPKEKRYTFRDTVATVCLLNPTRRCSRQPSQKKGCERASIQ
jgi:hypothetical protein